LVDSHKIDADEQLRHMFAWGSTFRGTKTHKEWDEDRQQANNVKTFGEYYGFKVEAKAVTFDIQKSGSKKTPKSGSGNDLRVLEEGKLEKKVPNKF
jgi:hypothetical protein